MDGGTEITKVKLFRRKPCLVCKKQCTQPLGEGTARIKLSLPGSTIDITFHETEPCLSKVREYLQKRLSTN